MSVIVEFQSVGRAKRTWTTILPELSEVALYRAVKQRGALGSREIDFDYNEDEKRGLIVVGGFRVVGAFKVTEATR